VKAWRWPGANLLNFEQAPISLPRLIRAGAKPGWRIDLATRWPTIGLGPFEYSDEK